MLMFIMIKDSAIMIHTTTLTLNVMPFNCSYDMVSSLALTTLWRKTCLVYEEGMKQSLSQIVLVRKVK